MAWPVKPHLETLGMFIVLLIILLIAIVNIGANVWNSIQRIPSKKESGLWGEKRLAAFLVGLLYFLGIVVTALLFGELLMGGITWGGIGVTVVIALAIGSYQSVKLYRKRIGEDIE